MIETIAAIQRRKGLEGVLASYTPSYVDGEKPVATVGEHPFAALLEKYEAFLGMYAEYQKVSDKSRWVSNCIHGSSSITDILSSDEINQFLQIILNYEEREEYQDMTGIFITRLIQNSYNAGNNDFQLDTRSLAKNLNYLGAYLKGNEENKMQISITGNVGDGCGLDANNSAFNITGNVGNSCGSRANNSTYTITGDVGYLCGGGAENSTFNITGDVGYDCGFAAINSTFKTSNKETLKKLRKTVPYDNTIIYMKQDSTEEVIR